MIDLFDAWLRERVANDPVVSRVGIEAMLESERSQVLRDRLADTSREFRAVVAEIARADQHRGNGVRGIDPDTLATLIGAVGDGLFLHACLDPELDAAAALTTLKRLLRA